MTASPRLLFLLLVALHLQCLYAKYYLVKTDGKAASVQKKNIRINKHGVSSRKTSKPKTGSAKRKDKKTGRIRHRNKALSSSGDYANPGYLPVNETPVNSNNVNSNPVYTKHVNQNTVNPNPVNQKPVNSNPLKPNPVKPNLFNPKPVNPQPINPQPVNPKPVNQKPVNPKPLNPKPVYPKPVYPKPVNPKPVYPIPETSIGDPGPVNLTHFKNSTPINPNPVNPNPNPGLDPETENFLSYIGLHNTDIKEKFTKEQVTWDILKTMNYDHLGKIGITSFGHQHKIITGIKKLIQGQPFPFMSVIF